MTSKCIFKNNWQKNVYKILTSKWSNLCGKNKAVNSNLFNQKHLGKVDTFLYHLFVFVYDLLMSRQLPLGLVTILYINMFSSQVSIHDNSSEHRCRRYYSTDNQSKKIKLRWGNTEVWACCGCCNVKHH